MTTVASNVGKGDVLYVIETPDGGYRLTPYDPGFMASAYTAGIIQNHSFVDANKRTGFVIGVLFLELNGYHFSATEAAAADAVLALAAGTLTEADYTNGAIILLYPGATFEPLSSTTSRPIIQGEPCSPLALPAHSGEWPLIPSKPGHLFQSKVARDSEEAALGRGSQDARIATVANTSIQVYNPAQEGTPCATAPARRSVSTASSRRVAWVTACT